MNLESKLLYILVQSNPTTAKEWKKLESEKLIILLGMFVVTLCFGILPIRIFFLSRPSTIDRTQGNEDSTQAQIHRHKHNTRWKTIIGFANCFSGGVFVAACLLDLFPDVREAVNNVKDEIKKEYHIENIDYPVPEFIIVLGFFLVLIIEQIVVDFKERWLHRQHKDSHSMNNADAYEEPVDLESHNADETTSLISNPAGAPSISVAQRQSSYYEGDHPERSIRKRQATNNYGSTIADSSQLDPAGLTGASVNDVSFAPVHEHAQPHDSIQQSPTTGNAGSTNQIEQAPELANRQYNFGDESGHGHDEMFVKDLSTIRSFLLLIALTFHSIFEGLAIGLQESSLTLLQIFIAVIVHKAVMAFSLGLNLAQATGMTVKKYILASLIFSTASPLGMGLGILLSHLHQSLARDIANGTLQGIAGGTFLYITFFEVLPHEFEAKTKYRLPKVFCVIAGYSVICMLLFVTHD